MINIYLNNMSIQKILDEFDERWGSKNIGLEAEGITSNGDVYGENKLKQFLTNVLTETREETEKKTREETIKELENKVACVGFSEEPNFKCKNILPIKEMQATVKNPNKFYCKECYRRGLDMEYEAMGIST